MAKHRTLTPAADAPQRLQHFASDNYAGICPPALRWFLEANGSGHQPAYGDDIWTERSSDLIRELFQTDCDVYFVFTGGAANSLALASLCQSYHSVICTPVAHIETDECGGPEFFSNGSKLLVAGGDPTDVRAAKLTPDAVEQIVTKRDDIHFPKPKVVSLTQSTEFGTVYTVEEVRAISAIAKRRHLKVHMDGARFANAVAALDCHPSDITWRAGVDVLCFGGTKNGLAIGEAVVFFDRRLSEDFAYRVKQAGHLGSKMRFISAPWVGMLEDDVWLSNARHANAMAQRMYRAICDIDGVRVMHPPAANAVFAYLPQPAIERLHRDGWRFYDFIAGGGCRLMCAWDTTPEAVDAFAADLARACADIDEPRRGRRAARTVGRGVVVAALLLMLAGCIEKMFFYPDARVWSTPAQLGLDADEVVIDGPDGARLHGWWLKARTQPARGAVLQVHGNAANIGNHLPLVAWLPAAGWNVLLFDYRGFGRSEGRPTLDGVVADTRAALDWLRARPADERRRLVVVGQSLGGATAARVLAADARDVHGLIVDSAFSSYRGIAREAAGPLGALAGPLLAGLPGVDADPLAAMRRLELPLLVLHGSADRVIPPRHGEALFAAAAAADKQWWPIDGGHHLDALMREPVRRRLLDWLAQR